MGLAPWGALGGGAFKTEEQRKQQEGRKVKPSESEIKISQVLESIAKRKDTALTSVALAYVMHKTPYVFPIVGGRTKDHLKGNIEALKIHLSKEDLKEVDEAVPFDLGFPTAFLYRGGDPDVPQAVWLLAMAGTFDYLPVPQPITPNEN